MWTTSYIHMNPVKDKIAVNPYDYKWSSYNDFANNRDLPITCKDLIVPTFGTRESFIKETFGLVEGVSRPGLDTLD